jgi:peptidoglycan/xylan/chitin deacetylase (PgdA/CDA1 family)
VSAARIGAIARGALDRLGVLDRYFWMRARLGERTPAVLTYHRVGRAGDAGELDRGVVEATPEELDDHLTILRTRCTVIGIADVRAFARGRRLPPNPVLVTFDDGYTDSLDVAVPILRRAGVPATFFIPTSFPDAGKLFWWDRVALLMRRCQRDRVELTYPERLALEPRRGAAAAARAICEAIKRTRDIDLERLWEAIACDAGVSLAEGEERTLAARTILGWSGVRRLRDAGMDVQSHSHQHLVLNSLAPDATRRDLARSSALLHDALGDAPYGVAYPVGYMLDATRRATARAAGFEIGFTNGTGRSREADFDPLNIPRISMDLGLSGASFKTRLLFGDGRWSRATWPPPARA